jgi:hypothetical protein
MMHATINPIPIGFPMSAKQKRPSVLDIGSLLVSQPVAVPENNPETDEDSSEPEGRGGASLKRAKARPAKVEDTMFRTSVYFSRLVHDKLRAIAFEERKTITDLINEGLDHVLQSRNYPSTSKLREKAR